MSSGLSGNTSYCVDTVFGRMRTDRYKAPEACDTDRWLAVAGRRTQKLTQPGSKRQFLYDWTPAGALHKTNRVKGANYVRRRRAQYTRKVYCTIYSALYIYASCR